MRLAAGAGLALAAVALAGLTAFAAAASDEVFTVGNYPVDAEADNAVAAKKQALTDGQQAAFRSLLKRLVPVTDYDRLKRLSAMKSSGFFEGVAVRSERNSATRYIASLDFSFRPDSVRSILQQEGIPFIEEQAREVIIVPVVLGEGGVIDKGSAARAWTSAWNGLDLDRTLTPASLEAMKPDFPTDALKAAAESGGGVERALAEAYASPYVVLAIAQPDPAAQRLNVTLTGIDAVGNLALRRSYKVFDGDNAYSMELAAVIGLGVLEGRWKAAKLPQASAPAWSADQISVRAQYESLGEWRRMREQLETLPDIAVHIEAESARGAYLSLSYPGGANALASALYARGLALENGSDRLILRSAY